MEKYLIIVFVVVAFVVSGCSTPGKVKPAVSEQLSVRDSDYFDSLTKYMTLYIYPSGKSSFTLYDEKLVTIKCLEVDGRITIEMSSSGKYYLLKIHYPGISQVSIDGKTIDKYTSSPELKNSSSGWVQDNSKNLILLKAFLGGESLIKLK